jgi:hypothetical protein
VKPATAKARALLGKLERLADPANGGPPGEIAAAKRKLQRLRSHYDFSKQDPGERDTLDIFSGIHLTRSARRTVRIHAFKTPDFDIANSVKWAIEQATGIPCNFRDGELSAAVNAATAKQLGKIARHITRSFETLLSQFGKLHGVTTSDRRLFVRGLYDGMMNDPRGVGERLPGAVNSQPKRKKRTKTVAEPPPPSPRLAVHPYTIALDLGRQIRLAAPLEAIAAELDRVTQPALGPASAAPAR